MAALVAVAVTGEKRGREEGTGDANGTPKKSKKAKKKEEEAKAAAAAYLHVQILPRRCLFYGNFTDTCGLPPSGIFQETWPCPDLTLCTQMKELSSLWDTPIANL